MADPASPTAGAGGDAAAAATAAAAADPKAHRKMYSRKSIMEMNNDEKVAKVQALIRGRKARKNNPRRFKAKNLKGSATVAATLKKDEAAKATADAAAATASASSPTAAATPASPVPSTDPNAQYIALLTTALATENVDEISAAIGVCVDAQWTKHRLFESAEKTLKQIKQQIKTLAFLEKAVSSRRMVDLEQALNMAEEYDLNKTDEAREIATTRNAIVELKSALENAPQIEDAGLIDGLLNRCKALGLEVGSAPVAGDDAAALAAQAAHNKEYEWMAIARARRDVLTEREKLASELAQVVKSSDLPKLEAAMKKCADANFPTAHPLYEAAQIKLAELQAKEGKAAPKSVGEKKKMDPYSVKGGAQRPAVSIQQYAIPKYILHKCPVLRSGDDYSNGTLWNRKRVKAYQLLWQADPVHRSVTNLDEKKIPKLNDTVQRIFKIISGWMGDKPEPPLTSDLNAIELMKLGHAREELRDEIYTLILKQLTVNPKTESTVRGWQLLGLICEAFPPSDTMLPYVYHYIYYNSKVEVCSWAAYAKYCMYTLHNTVNEPLKPVTDFTIDHVVKFRTRKMEAGKARVYFLDGSELDVSVEPHDRVCDSLQTIFERIKLRDRPGFGIFQVGQTTTQGKEEGREIWIPLNACLLDYDPQMRPSVSPVLYKQQAARLVFKRRLYTDLTSPDPMAQKLLYYQTLADICNENLPVENDKQIRLCALHRVLDQAMNPTNKPPETIADPNMLTVVAVRNIVPVAIENGQEKKKEMYLLSVAKAKNDLMTTKAGKTVPNVKVEFETLLKEVREHQLFGCQYFTTKALEDRKKEVPKGLMMGISSQGIYLVSGKEKKVFEDYPFFQISRFECNGDRFKLYCKVKNSKTLNCFAFKTEEADEIAALMTTLLEDIASVSMTDN